MTIIDVRQISKRFGPSVSLGEWVTGSRRHRDAVVALQDVSFSLQAGEVCVIMGPNGAGKTTLLRILSGILPPTSGTVVIKAQNIAHQTKTLRAEIGCAFGDRPGFYDRLTGRQNLMFFAALHGLTTRAATQRIRELADLIELDGLERPYQEQSAGMKQRLLLARALLHDPPLLLLDEPTKSLDVAYAQSLRQLIRDRLHGSLGKTILFTTHQLEDMDQLAGRVAILSDGRLRGWGTVAELTAAGTLRDALLQHGH